MQSRAQGLKEEGGQGTRPKDRAGHMPWGCSRKGRNKVYDLRVGQDTKTGEGRYLGTK